MGGEGNSDASQLWFSLWEGQVELTIPGQGKKNPEGKHTNILMPMEGITADLNFCFHQAYLYILKFLQ